jgi:hypothetical protein
MWSEVIEVQDQRIGTGSSEESREWKYYGIEQNECQLSAGKSHGNLVFEELEVSL